MPDKSDDSIAVAARLIRAIEAGDIDGVRGIYDADARIWHNNDNAEQTVEENLRVLTWVTRNIGDLRYEDIRRLRTDTGFVETHVLRGTAPNGGVLDIPACLIGTVREGRITRLEEYLDSAHLAPLLG